MPGASRSKTSSLPCTFRTGTGIISRHSQREPYPAAVIEGHEVGSETQIVCCFAAQTYECTGA